MTRKSDHEWFEAMHNQYQGRAFAIGTGPSLNRLTNSQIASLGREVTFAVNRLYDWSKLSFNPSFWGGSEVDFRDRYSVGWANYPGDKIWGANTRPIDGWRWLFRDAETNLASRRFHQQVANADFLGLGLEMWRYPTTQSPIFDIAVPSLFWFGFDTVYLVGCDNRPEGYCYEERERFPEYQLEGHYARIYKSVENILDILEKSYPKRQLIDLTPGGALTAPKQDVREVLGE